MDLDALRELAWRSMGKRRTAAEREPGFVFHHGQRVAKIALQLRELVFPGDASLDEVILVGGWFHDVGKGIEPHWQYGAILAREMLQPHCSPEELERIVEIVGCHTLRKEREYPYYVQLVQDADVLDHYGSMDVWLDFRYCAVFGHREEEALEFYGEKYEENVARISRLLNFPVAVEIFQEKTSFVWEFAQRFWREARGELILDQKKAKG